MRAAKSKGYRVPQKGSMNGFREFRAARGLHSTSRRTFKGFVVWTLH